MAGQAVFSVQMDRSGAYIAKTDGVEATVEKSGKKKMQCKTKLCIAAAVVALLIIVGLAVMAILPHLDEDSLDFATNHIDDFLDASQPCNNPPTGLMQMTTGVKILEVDTDPRSIGVSGDAETSQIIALTCNDKKTFVDQNGKEWDLPDQVAFIENIYVGQTSGSTSVFESVSEYDSYRSGKLGLKVGKSNWLGKIFGIVKKKKSSSWSYYRNMILDSDRRIIKAFTFFGSYKIVFKSYGGLTFEPSVMKTFKTLPDCSDNVTDDCKTPYKDFIDFHGTHYYSQASLGGRAWSYFTMTSSYFSGYSRSELQGKAKASFFYFVGTGDQDSGISQSSLEAFQSETEHEVSYKGGKAEYYSRDTFNEWRDSVLSYPAKFEHELAPIYFLIDEKDPRRKIMEEAFGDYIDERE